MGNWSEITYWGYGVLNFKPQELLDLDPIIFCEMVESKLKVIKEENEMDMQKLAWQTSIIINCMGTLKKKIKPTDLYNPNATEESKGGLTYISEEEKESKQSELLSTFNIS